MILLLTNDDGINSQGLKALEKALQDIGQVWVIAPDRERNAIGRALTLHRPLRVNKIAPRRFSVNGTPSDCVNLAINGLLPEKPKLVVSGINKGANLGDDVSYSGTISAAFEATVQGVPAFAISLAARSNFKFQPSALFAKKMALVLLRHRLPPDTFFNINVPDTNGRRVETHTITRMGKSIYDNSVIEKVDPRGGKYYWIGGNEIKFQPVDKSDFQAIANGVISITPLKTDHTNYAFINTLKRWKI
jgi:5'-nucleotidase